MISVAKNGNATSTPKENSMNYETMSPAEIDTILYPILEKIAKAEHYKTNYEKILNDKERNTLSYQVKEYEKKIQDYTHEIEDLNIEAYPLEREYDNRQWTRYIVVPGGHLHMRHCHTLTPGRTMVGQVAEASGLTKDEVVKKYDVVACTHCFPDAPVHHEPTLEEQGMCEMSGKNIHTEPALAKQLANLKAQYPTGWSGFMVARGIRCNCGGYPSLTKSDNVRKHKPGTPAL
jgi:hypothetical protein